MEGIMLSARNKLRPGRATILAVAGMALLSSSAIAQKGGNPNPGVIPPNSQYKDLSVQWWRWALQQPVTPNDPATTNPLVDTTGVAAHNGQPDTGNVFFLAGLISFNSGLVAKAERTITIPTGTRLFFPILNVEEDNVGVDPPLTVDQLRALAAFNATQVTSLYVIIDGVPLNDLGSYRVISPVFDYVLPPNDPAGGSVNILYYATGGALNVTGLVAPAVGDGYYVLLTPLQPGKHTIKFGGTTQTLDGNGNPATFELDITYNITVKAGK
jgi:hypothetical protein